MLRFWAGVTHRLLLATPGNRRPVTTPRPGRTAPCRQSAMIHAVVVHDMLAQRADLPHLL
jgi:hypothetical protein